MNNNLKQSTLSSAMCDNRRSGVALVLAVVVLAILTATVYPLASRLSMIKHRRQYTIDYQKSRYACDSAMKYALARMRTTEIKLVSRKDEPDFSDLFTLDKGEYQQLLQDWTEVKALQAMEKYEQQLQEEVEWALENPLLPKKPLPKKTDSRDKSNDSVSNFKEFFENVDFSDPNVFDASGELILDPNMVVIPGPYGPQWPYIVEPIEFEMGDAKVTIEIEDENAKMPLTWAITSDKNAARLAAEAIEVFCEWMQIDRYDMEDLYKQLEEVAKHKKFAINPRPITTSRSVTSATTSRTTSALSRSRLIRRPTMSTKIIKETRPIEAHSTDFARLMHSSLLDLERLAQPIPNTGERTESAMKYLALWGSRRVNINTAPRHVLEAALTFGGNAAEIADELIRKRRQKPYKTVDELESGLYGYSQSIKRAKPYLITASTLFSIRVTAVCGTAKTVSVAPVIKDSKGVKRLVIVSGR